MNSTYLSKEEVYEAIVGKTLATAELYDDKDVCQLSFEDGSNLVLEVYGDCCSRSWIEHLEVVPGALGSVVVSVSEDEMGREDSEEYDVLKSYALRIRTLRGDVTMEFRNSSNGYYGGSVAIKAFNDVSAK